MSTDTEGPVRLASVGIGHAIVILSQSFALLAYKRALTPLYSSTPASSYISYATVVSAVLGSVVDVPTNVAALTYGSLLAAAPNTVHYVGKYTGRWRDPVLGPIITHTIVLVPILVSGVALLQSVHVRAADNSSFHITDESFAVPSSAGRVYCLGHSASRSCCSYSRHLSLSGTRWSNCVSYLLQRS